jgi:hypothetical protein
MIHNVLREYISCCCHSLFVWRFGMPTRGTSVSSWKSARLPCGSSLCFTEYKSFNSGRMEAYGAILECEEAVCCGLKELRHTRNFLCFYSSRWKVRLLVLYSRFQYLRKSVLHFVYCTTVHFVGCWKEWNTLLIASSVQWWKIYLLVPTTSFSFNWGYLLT